MNLNWIDGLGGPLIVCDDLAAKEWSGTKDGHYELAGSIVDYLGVLKLGNNEYASLWGDDLSATFNVKEQRFFFIARLVYADDIKNFEKQLFSFMDRYRLTETVQQKIHFKSNTIYLMDATNNIMDGEIYSFCIQFVIQGGLYEIYTHEVDFDLENRAVIHAFIETEHARELRSLNNG